MRKCSWTPRFLLCIINYKQALAFWRASPIDPRMHYICMYTYIIGTRYTPAYSIYAASFPCRSLTEPGFAMSRVERARYVATYTRAHLHIHLYMYIEALTWIYLGAVAPILIHDRSLPRPSHTRGLSILKTLASHLRLPKLLFAISESLFCSTGIWELFSCSSKWIARRLSQNWKRKKMIEYLRET